MDVVDVSSSWKAWLTLSNSLIRGDRLSGRYPDAASVAECKKPIRPWALSESGGVQDYVVDGISL